MNDTDLLRRYATKNDQSAFAELVQRHVNLVYGAALRHVAGDTHLAEDIAQQVFCDFARKAPALIDHPSIPGWLYASARFTSVNTIRREQRRATREQKVEIMHDSSTTAEPQWEHIRPLIDEAMQDLDEVDREPVVLRFFGQQPFTMIAAQLGVSENAVQKRVDRALDRLNAALGRRGINSTSAALAVALGQAGVAAPATLATLATTKALAAATTAAVGASVTASLGKMLIAAAASAVVGFAGGVGYHAKSASEQSGQLKTALTTQLRDMETRLRAESQRADTAEADTAKLLAAVEQMRAKSVAVQPNQVVTTPKSITPITVPPESRYTVGPGDTGVTIAQNTGLTLDELVLFNPSVDWARLRVGQQVRVK